MLLVAFHSVLSNKKKASTHAVYDVISSCHSNQLSPNASKMCLKDIRTASEDGMSVFAIILEFLPATRD